MDWHEFLVHREWMGFNILEGEGSLLIGRIPRMDPSCLCFESTRDCMINIPFMMRPPFRIHVSCASCSGAIKLKTL